MRTQIKPEQATGRTVEGFRGGMEQVVALLSGDAFVYIEDNPRGDSHFLEHTIFRFEDNLPGAVRWGLCTEAEAETLRVARRERDDACQEKRERAEYERLRAKFEGKP